MVDPVQPSPTRLARWCCLMAQGGAGVHGVRRTSPRSAAITRLISTPSPSACWADVGDLIRPGVRPSRCRWRCWRWPSCYPDGFAVQTQAAATADTRRIMSLAIAYTRWGASGTIQRIMTEYDASGLGGACPGSCPGLTADGERSDAVGVLAASHHTLQLPAIARVTNLENGRQTAGPAERSGAGSSRGG